MKDNHWAMLCHLLGLTGYLGNGLGSVVAPLVLWMLKKDDLPIVDRNGRQALNFNMSVAVYGFCLVLFSIFTVGIGSILAFPLLFALGAFHLVFVLIASVKAYNGEEFRYPLCIQFM